MGKVQLAVMFLAALLLRALIASAECCGDCNGDGQVTIDEILTSVNNALNGCHQSPTPGQLVTITIPVVGGGGQPVDALLLTAPSVGKFVVQYVCFEGYAVRVWVIESSGAEYLPPVTSTATTASADGTTSITCNSIDPGYVLPEGSQLVCRWQSGVGGGVGGRCWVTGESTN